MPKQLLPHLEEIQRRYIYDPETGTLCWRINQRRAKAGSPAGSVYSNGYLMVYVAGQPTLAHRVAWVLVTGEEPPGCDRPRGQESSKQCLGQFTRIQYAPKPRQQDPDKRSQATYGRTEAGEQVRRKDDPKRCQHSSGYLRYNT